MKPSVVLDTNVIVAGLRSRNGASFQILSMLAEDRFEWLMSVPLFLEYEAVLKRQDHQVKHGLSPSDVDVLLRFWAARCRPVHLHYLWRPQLRDPKDEMVLETAVNGGADALVTLNQADFKAAVTRFRLRLWTPAELLKRLRSTS